MRTVLRIFRDDIRSVGRRFFALAIIVAISGLPALYAWVNIYANGDPYANTGAIPIAVASTDPGIDLGDGTHVNMAEEVFDDLRQSDKIGWQFPDTAEEAIAGVESGKYYAAIIIENNFTYNMYNFEQALLDRRAPLTFYENTKKNAVAAKIAETAAENVRESITTKYLETVFSVIFDETNETADALSRHDAADTVIGQMKELSATLREYDKAIDAFTGKSKDVHSGIADAEKKLAKTRREANDSATSAKGDLANARRSLVVLQRVLEEREKQIENERAGLEQILRKLIDDEPSPAEREALRREALERLNRLKTRVESLLSFFPESDTGVTKAIRETLLDMLADIDDIETMLRSDTLRPDMLQRMLEELNALSRVSLASDVSSFINTMDRTLELMEPLMESMSVMLDDVDPVLDSADGTVTDLNASLVQMQKLFRTTADRVDDTTEKIEGATENNKIALLRKLLGGDPEEYARFFSALVNVNVEEVYSVASYGAAMSPFYSVLAIWVGGVILVSILKTHIDRKKYPGVTEAQGFFGRFLLFFFVGQAQAAIIIAGDILLLHVGPVHPGLMFLAAAVTSLVFVLLIYALTLSFGDIGKAMVVIVMVVQIAGSSGSYPIEILPPVFAKIYRFFPFPYAINAMREALCGTYANDYFIYLGELLIFAVVALAIGLFVRKPFISMNNFVSEKLEETEVL